MKYTQSDDGRLAYSMGESWKKCGENTFIHPTAIIYDDVIIGDNCYIGPYCIIGAPAEYKKHWGKKMGSVIISNGCVLTGHCTVDAGTEGNTILQKNVWMLKHSHVGHDAYIGEDAVISVGAIIGGHTIIETDCNIGLNACIHQNLVVPPGCMIGMGCIVTKKTQLKEWSKYVGNPARYLSPNIKP